ncbi:MAG: DUF885 family protein [Streptosporangiaceae bacterium]
MPSTVAREATAATARLGVFLDDDPGAHLGMLDMQMMSASNVALDIGVHLELEIPRGTGWREGERWNAGIAWEFLQAHSSWDEKRLRFELHRYLGWPGQVPSYKLGERAWLQAREEARARAGGAFSLKDFHSKALSLGGHGPGPVAQGPARKLMPVAEGRASSRRG